MEGGDVVQVFDGPKQAPLVAIRLIKQPERLVRVRGDDHAVEPLRVAAPGDEPDFPALAPNGHDRIADADGCVL